MLCSWRQKRDIETLEIKPQLHVKVSTISRTMELGKTVCSLPPAWEKQWNAKIVMANGTSCEPAMDDVDLNKCDKKIENKQKFTCLKDSDKFKRSW